MGQNQVKRDAESPETTPFLEGGSGGGDGGGGEKPSDPDPNINFTFPLHLAACCGELEKLRVQLLADNPSSVTDSSWTRWLDESGRTPLHCATHPKSSHNLAVIQLLLQRDKEDDHDPSYEGKPSLLANLPDAYQKTALHYAAESQEPRVVSLLLEFGADPNVKDAQGSSPLHILAESNADSSLECAQLILNSPSLSPSAGSESNARKLNAVHIATMHQAPKLLKLFVEQGFDFASPDPIEGRTPLMVACSKEDGGDSEENVECVRILLGAYSRQQVNAKEGDEEGQTALQMAAARSLLNVLKVFLSSKKTDLFAKDCHGYTVFHYAVIAGYRGKSLSCVKLICECEQMKVDKGKIVEYMFNSHKLKKDNEDWMSPIEIAVYFRRRKIVDYLLAAHPRKDQWMSDEGLMSLIYSRLPTVLVPRMDASLKYNSAGLGKLDDVVEVDFRIITGDKDPVEQRIPETKFLYQINQAPEEVQKVILLHPLVQIFLDSKWERIRQLTWMHIFLQLSWILSYTLMVYEMYTPNCHNFGGGNQTQNGENGDRGGGVEGKGHIKILHSLGFLAWEGDCRFHQTLVQSTAIILYILSAFVLAKEVFQLRMKSYWYFWDFINLAQLGIIVTAVVNSVPAWQLTSASDLAPWQTNLAAGGIFVAWVMVLREVDNIPKCGVYSAILRKVFWHCLKMLLFYSPLLIGFAMCLRILTPGKGQYNYLLFSLIKVVVMMTGELDFEDAFYGDDNNPSGGPSTSYAAIFGQVVFLMLVFVTTIVLLNLLTGLAVADVGRLLEEADVHRLSLQLERMYLLECLIVWARNRIKCFDSWRDLLYRWNATGIEGWDGKQYFYCAEQCLEIKDYRAELKARIREVMVAAEEL